MNAAQLTAWMNDPQTMDASSVESLRRLVSLYPCFSAARMLLYKARYDAGDLTADEDLTACSLQCPDRARLYAFVCGDSPVSPVVETPISDGSVKEDASFGLIEAFLSESGETADEDLGRVVPYSLEEVYSAEDVSLPPQVERFLDNPAPVSPSGEEVFPPEAAMAWDSLPELSFTETLAKIYLKQRKYERALEIFKSLDLNNPKKSIYFAAQIKFLEKIVEQLKQ